MECKLVLGGPGTGKTRRLIEILETELERGVLPERVAFVSFTRAAIHEALQRIMARFGLTTRDFPYCRTIHSLAFEAVGLSRGRILSNEHIPQVEKYVGVPVKIIDPRSTAAETLMSDGDLGIFLHGLARSTRVPLRKVWEASERKLQWRWLSWFVDSLTRFKQAQCLFDFTDMLEMYLEHGAPIDVDVAIIDEAQDLSALQWEVVRRAFANAKRMYIGGDDDQAIYRWSGADVDTFLGITADATEVLPLSYRLSPKIWEYSQHLVSRVSRRFPKVFRPAPNGTGEIYHHRSLQYVPFDPAKTHLVLARTRRDLGRFKSWFHSEGIPFMSREGSSIIPADARAIHGWLTIERGGTILGSAANDIMERVGSSERYREDDHVDGKRLRVVTDRWYNKMINIDAQRRAYYATIMLKGFDITASPKTRVDTIHSVKGREADVVVISTALSKQSRQAWSRNADDETRVWYVGVTRSRSDLHIVRFRSKYQAPI